MVALLVAGVVIRDNQLAHSVVFGLSQLRL
jgi:hypothetical protein